MGHVKRTIFFFFFSFHESASEPRINGRISHEFSFLKIFIRYSNIIFYFHPLKILDYDRVISALHVI